MRYSHLRMTALMGVVSMANVLDEKACAEFLMPLPRYESPPFVEALSSSLVHVGINTGTIRN